MAVIVTGANGFVGREMVSLLGSRHMDVLAIGGRSQPSDAPEIGESTPRILHRGLDLTAQEPLEPLFEGVEAIIHLAGRAHIRAGSAEDSAVDYEVLNVNATRRLAVAAARMGVKRFIYVSTIGVNGDETKTAAFTEGDTPNPHNRYSRSKWLGELALADVARETGLEVVVVRPALIIGPQAKANLLTLLKLVDRGLPLPFGAIRNRRNYAGLANLTEFLALCLTHENAAAQTFLFADRPSISTPDLIRQLATFLDRKAILLPMPARLLKAGARAVGFGSAMGGLWNSLEIDMGHAASILGWKQPHLLEDSLRSAAHAYRAARLQASA